MVVPVRCDGVRIHTLDYRYLLELFRTLLYCHINLQARRSTTIQMPSLKDLEAAAADVIAILKDIPGLSEARVAVIGGLALWKYMPRGRTTEVNACLSLVWSRRDIDISVGR